MLTVLPLAFLAGFSPITFQADDDFTQEERSKIDAGWRRQDLEWIPPDEVENIDQGLWKCGDDWLTLEQANAWHADVERWWRIPGEHAVLSTTLARTSAERAVQEIEGAYRDLVRFYGVEPSEKLLVVALNSRDQYMEFTGGSMERREWGKTFFMHRVHGAYFADLWFDDEGKHVGAGVAYWAIGTDEAAFGPLWIRHAAGQAFADQIDPSPEALESLEGKELGFEFVMGFWAEKKLPTWLRVGTASYVERYFVDESEYNNGDPLWARKWSMQNLGEKAGDVDDILRGSPDPREPEKAKKFLNQAGLLVAFVLDGESKSVTKAHEKFVKALGAYRENPKKGEKPLKKAIDGLEKALEKNERKLKKFAGL